jgi:putative ABC transport system permease protein
MTLALAGLALGLAGSFAAGRLLGRFLFGVTSHDAVTFSSVGILLALVALAACIVPAYRATRVDPMVALRYE